MVYRNYDELTILKVSEHVESISYDTLAETILGRPSNIIYCEAGGKLSGIISMGDITKAGKDKLSAVPINRHFKYLTKKQYMKAREIFKEKRISSLPIVETTGHLTGDYSCWDDRWMEYTFFCGQRGINESIKREADENHPLILVKPCRHFPWKQKQFEKLCKYLEYLCVPFLTVERTKLETYFDRCWIVFSDEDELRATVTLFRSIYDKELVKFLTYKGLLGTGRTFDTIKKKFDSFFHKLNERGVPVFGLVFEDTEYLQFLSHSIQAKLKFPDMTRGVRFSRELEKGFFEDLYTEEYAEQILTIPFQVKNAIGELKDRQSRYYNVTNGERCTEGQPDDYDRTIYFFGSCIICGVFVEDKNTIESFLQMRLREAGKKIRVVNCGTLEGASTLEIIMTRVMVTQLKKGDMIVIARWGAVYEGIREIELTRVLEKYHVNPNWFTDHVWHCNHKVNAIYADAIYDALLPVLEEAVDGQGKLVAQDGDYIKPLYLDKYFYDFNTSAYATIGSIVMNCNPFTYGHRYLIEQALKEVDFLIIFVVEEDRSIFSFNERYACVCEGVADLKNVKVVPSGAFILTQRTFPEYFIKETDEELVENAENDITFFAKQIAPPLNITHRFVGEEPEDMVTNEYNLAMKHILPGYGIKLVEIPRKEQNGSYISASRVRKCLQEYDMDGIKELVPKSTIRILGLNA